MNEPRFLTVDTADLSDGSFLVYDASLHKIVAASDAPGGGIVGPAGPRGADTTASLFHFGFEPPEQKNSHNLEFSLPVPFVAGTTQVYLNGVRQRQGNSAQYIENTATHTIHFSIAPDGQSDLWVDFIEDTSTPAP
jgi:hypothetical protein